MAYVNLNLTAAERAARSVFVGNIPYEATEEQLKEIFNQAGPVASFRYLALDTAIDGCHALTYKWIVYDRENGKPKGYGFCEYQDVETAQSAIRNLNNTDFNGRPLRVGAAAGESNFSENKPMQQAMGGPILESPYGDPVEPHEAPEAISKAVASLPPEQMYELMKQMKACIQNNPGEARKMLLQNPQLAYALLQAQIVMKIVDPQVALAMLHRERDTIPPVKTDEPSPAINPAAVTNTPTSVATTAQLSQNPGSAMNPMNALAGGMGNPMGNNMGPGGGMMPGMGMNRLPMGNMGNPTMNPMNPMGMRGMNPMGGPGPMGMGNRMGMNPMGQNQMGRPQGPGFMGQGGPMGAQGGPMGGPAPMGAPGPGPAPAAGGTGGADQEKAQLIMQVLQLSDEQIAMLPPDQRESILLLKQQIGQQKH